MTDTGLTARLVRQPDDPEWIIGWVMGPATGPWLGFRFEFPGKELIEGDAPVKAGGDDDRDFFPTESEAVAAVLTDWVAHEEYMHRELGDGWKEHHRELERAHVRG